MASVDVLSSDYSLHQKNNKYEKGDKHYNKRKELNNENEVLHYNRNYCAFIFSH